MKTTVDAQEVAKFAEHAQQWWDKDGPLKTLHDINPARLDFTQQYMPLSGRRVLDVGCGGGIFAEGMALLGAQVTGLDVEKDAIATAQCHANASHLAIEYICQPIEIYSAPPFDAITCMEMLEHVADPYLVLEHCARLLKPGGFLFLSTINRTLKAYASVILVAEYLLNLLPRQTHDFDKFIKPSELAKMARMSGFNIIGIKGMDYNPISRTASLSDAVSINYLLVCQKP